MTLTDTRPATPAAGDGGAGADVSAAGRRGGWLDTADHTRLGLLFLYAAFAFLLVGVAAGMLLRGELAEPGVQLLKGDYGRTFSLHATVLTLLFLPGAWIGVATYVVPLQVGTNRLALARAHALALWLYIGGGLLLLATYTMERLTTAGLTLSTPAPAPEGGASTADDLWVVGAAIVVAAALVATLDLVVTVAKMRAPGMTLERVPLFSWSVLAAGAAQLVTLPVLLAGLMMLGLDQHFGGQLFETAGGGLVWQKALWLFGRPDLLLLAVPALGAACDIVATHARRALIADPAARGAIAAVATLAFGVWASGTSAGDALVLPTSTPLSAAAAAPVGLLVLVWLGTLATGRVRPHAALLFVVGAVLLWGLAALNAGIAFMVDVDGTAWTTGFLHLGFFSPPLLLLGAALVHWAPKLWGRAIGIPTAGLAALLLFGGAMVNGGGSLLLGYAGAPWHVDDVVGESSWTALSRLTAAGGILLTLGVLLLVFEIVRSAGRGPDADVGADPYEGLTLEWAVASPPGDGFATLPPVRSATPLADLRASSEVKA